MSRTTANSLSPIGSCTYLFYDLETSDLNPCFGQVLQFAAIRTDQNLDEISRCEIRIKLNSDVIPSPGALMTNRITIAQLLQGENEYDAIQKIHALFNTPGTISVGYNSLGFDDDFLRFSFYKNLLTPYTHQHTRNCGRMDIYPMVLFYSVFRPDTLKWPIVNGKISYKLEHLSRENQLTTGLAHDAMVDVQATLELARRLKQQESLWHYCINSFDKSADQKRFEQCQTKTSIGFHDYNTGIMIQPNGQGGLFTPVIFLGTSHTYSNQSLFLKLNSPNLFQCTADTIAETTQIIRKKFGEPPFFVSLAGHVLKQLTQEQQNQIAVAQQWLTDHPNLFAEICKCYQQFQYPTVENCDVNGALYKLDFPSDADKQRMFAFHAARPTEKLHIAKQFSQLAYGELALRIMARFFDDRLPVHEQQEWQLYLTQLYRASHSEKRVDYRGTPQRTVPETLTEIEQLTQTTTLDDSQKTILAELKNYLQRLQHATVNSQGFFSHGSHRELRQPMEEEEAVTFKLSD